MAKVTGPLFSIEARGKIADAMVFFPWKGKNIVREWKVPSNPKTGAQGDVRLFLGGLGRAGSVVNKLSQYATDAREVTPSGQTWLSKLVQYCRDTYMSDATAYEAKLNEFSGHAANAKFGTEAGTLGLAVFDITYKSTANPFTSGFQLYMLAAYGCAQYILDNTRFNRAPFTTALASWVDADVDSLVALLPAL